jgi:hypothetical protein
LFLLKDNKKITRNKCHLTPRGRRLCCLTLSHRSPFVPPSPRPFPLVNVKAEVAPKMRVRSTLLSPPYSHKKSKSPSLSCFQKFITICCDIFKLTKLTHTRGSPNHTIYRVIFRCQSHKDRLNYQY